MVFGLSCCLPKLSLFNNDKNKRQEEKYISGKEGKTDEHLSGSTMVDLRSNNQTPKHSESFEMGSRESRVFENEAVDGVSNSDIQISDSIPSEFLKKKNKQIVDKRATNDDDFESVRIVFLGTCNSGKSTLVKQLQNIFLDGPSEEKIELYRHLIIDNTLQAIKAVLTYIQKEMISFEDRTNEETGEYFMSIYDSNSVQLVDDEDGNLADKFEKMYSDKGFMKACELGPTYYLLESAKYFFNNFRRIIKEDYTPSQDDILMSRDSTLIVSKEIVPVADGLPIKIQDFGGYRFQRLQWYSYFTATIDAVVFVHSLACYNLSVEEDPTANQLDESLKVFEEIANLDLFKQLPVIVVLNKKDLFEEKLKLEPFSKYCLEYRGENTSDTILTFIKSKFRVLDKHRGNNFFAYVTNAVDKIHAKAVLKMIVKIAQQSHDEKTIKKIIEKENIGKI